MGRSRSRSPRKKSSRKRSRSREKKRRRRHSSSESDLDHKRRRDKTYVRFLNLFEATNFFYFSSQRSTGKIISLYVVDYWWIFLMDRAAIFILHCAFMRNVTLSELRIIFKWSLVLRLFAIYICIAYMVELPSLFLSLEMLTYSVNGTSMKLLFKYSFMALLLISMLTTK